MPVPHAVQHSRAYILRVGCGFVLGGICSAVLLYLIARHYQVWIAGWLGVPLVALISAITGAVGGFALDEDWPTTGAFAAAFALWPLISMAFYQAVRFVHGGKEGLGFSIIVAIVILVPALSYGSVGVIAAMLARWRGYLIGKVFWTFAFAGAVGGFFSPLLVRFFSPWALRPLGMIAALYSDQILTLFLAGAGLGFVLRRNPQPLTELAESTD